MFTAESLASWKTITAWKIMEYVMFLAVKTYIWNSKLQKRRKWSSKPVESVEPQSFTRIQLLHPAALLGHHFVAHRTCMQMVFKY